MQLTLAYSASLTLLNLKAFSNPLGKRPQYLTNQAKSMLQFCPLEAMPACSIILAFSQYIAMKYCTKIKNDSDDSVA